MHLARACVYICIYNSHWSQWELCSLTKEAQTSDLKHFSHGNYRELILSLVSWGASVSYSVVQVKQLKSSVRFYQRLLCRTGFNDVCYSSKDLCQQKPTWVFSINQIPLYLLSLEDSVSHSCESNSQEDGIYNLYFSPYNSCWLDIVPLPPNIFLFPQSLKF